MRSGYRRRKRAKGIMIWLCIVIILLIFLKKEAETPLADNPADIAEANTDDTASVNAIANHTPDAKILKALNSMVKQDKRIKSVIKNYDDYPEELLDMLSRNIEMLDFVLDYPEKKGNVYADTIGTTDNGSVPLLLQWDERWGYGNYGNSMIAVSGCGPTSLAMVIAGLTGDNSVTPYTVAEFAEENGYYVAGSGTSWDLFSEGSRHFGIRGKELSLSEASVKKVLQSGHPIICSMRPGDFTTTGHIIVLAGMKDGQIIICDPNSKARSNELWDYQTLEPQIRNLWSFDLL